MQAEFDPQIRGGAVRSPSLFQCVFLRVFLLVKKRVSAIVNSVTLKEADFLRMCTSSFAAASLVSFESRDSEDTATDEI